MDARPGGYVATGGHGGIIGQITHRGAMHLTYLPAYKHTYKSEVRLTLLPANVKAARKAESGIELIDVPVKDAGGKLLADAIPVVSIMKDGSYCGIEFGDDPELEIDMIASIEHKLAMGRLAGFVIEGLVPYGSLPSTARHNLMVRAAFSGIPVVKVGRNAPEGFADPHEFQIAGSNLTATKARLPADGLPAEVRQLPAREGSGKADPAGGRGREGGRGQVSGDFRYALRRLEAGWRARPDQWRDRTDHNIAIDPNSPFEKMMARIDGELRRLPTGNDPETDREYVAADAVRRERARAISTPSSTKAP